MFWIQSAPTKAGHFSQDLIDSLGLGKRLGILVGEFQIVMDGGFEILGAPVHAPPQLLFGEQAKPTPYLVQPVSAGGREMHVETRLFGQPLADQRRLVGGAVANVEIDVRTVGAAVSMVARNLRNSTARWRR